MLAKSRIRTSRYCDLFLQDRKTLCYLNFASRKVAEKNAAQYSKLLGQNITVFERIYPAGRSFVLKAETIIL